MIISCIHVFPTAEEFNFCGSRCVFVACHAQNVTNSTHSCNWYTNKSFSPIPFTTFCWEAFHAGSARGARHPALQPPQQEVMSWQSRTDAPIVAAGALGRHIWGRASHQPIGGAVGVGRRDQWNALLCDDFGFANVNCCSVSHWGCQSIVTDPTPAQCSNANTARQSSRVQAQEKIHWWPDESLHSYVFNAQTLKPSRANSTPFQK